jgi:hypothetical protein
MTLDEALDIVVSRTGHQHFRVLCREDNPDTWQRDGYRRKVLQLAEGGLASLIQKAASLTVAMVEATASGFEPVPEAEAERRQGICDACEYHEARDNTCKSCGCYLAIKTKLAVWRCPLNPPRWGPYVPPDS